MRKNTRLAIKLHEWHSGQSSGLYALGPCLFAGVEPDYNTVDLALTELRSELRQSHNTDVKYELKLLIASVNRIKNNMRKEQR